MLPPSPVSHPPVHSVQRSSAQARCCSGVCSPFNQNTGDDSISTGGSSIRRGQGLLQRLVPPVPVLPVPAPRQPRTSRPRPTLDPAFAAAASASGRCKLGHRGCGS